MKPLIYIFLSALVWTSCGSQKNMVEGAPAKTSKKHLLENIYAAENQFESLEINTLGDFNGMQISQGFRAHIRILKDSLIWIDLADPILGIKAARAILYKDSIAFINRLQRQYYTGSYKALLEKLNLDIDFYTLQSILAGNVAFGMEDYKLYYDNNKYVLADFSYHKQAEDDSPSMAGPTMHSTYIDPNTFKALSQIIDEPAFARKSTVNYAQISPQGGLLYPKSIAIQYQQNETSSLKLQIKSVTKDKELHYPFTIPANYERMR